MQQYRLSFHIKAKLKCTKCANNFRSSRSKIFSCEIFIQIFLRFMITTSRKFRTLGIITRSRPEHFYAFRVLYTCMHFNMKQEVFANKGKVSRIVKKVMYVQDVVREDWTIILDNIKQRIYLGNINNDSFNKYYK